MNDLTAQLAIASNASDPKAILDALNDIKVASRHPLDGMKLATPETLSLLLKTAKLDDIDVCPAYSDVELEAMKCVANILLISKTETRLTVQKGIVDVLQRRFSETVILPYNLIVVYSPSLAQHDANFSHMPYFVHFID